MIVQPSPIQSIITFASQFLAIHCSIFPQGCQLPSTRGTTTRNLGAPAKLKMEQRVAYMVFNGPLIVPGHSNDHNPSPWHHFCPQLSRDIITSMQTMRAVTPSTALLLQQCQGWLKSTLSTLLCFQTCTSSTTGGYPQFDLHGCCMHWITWCGSLCLRRQSWPITPCRPKHEEGVDRNIHSHGKNILL